MKRKSSYSLIALAAVLLAAFACTDGYRPESGSPEGLTRVEFRLPYYYGEGGFSFEEGVRTKADQLDDLRDLNHMKPGIQAFPVPEGRTLWLTYSVKQDDGEFSEPDLQAYQVHNAGGYNALYPCEIITTEGTDNKGNPVVFKSIDTTSASSPLYLAPGTYKFKMISPALQIIQEEAQDGGFNWKLPIDNGMYFCSTDGRYRQTVGKEIDITLPDPSVSKDYVQYVTLNPMIQQTVKMDFRIMKGENVDSLAILPAGVEISGLQNPGLNASYYWTSENIADTLVMKMGDKRSWVSLKPSGFRVDDNYTWDENRDMTISANEVFPGTLVGDIGVLPTDSRSTTVIITFNLLVNGIPTQYVSTLNEIVLQHGHSYVMNLKVWKEDGITLFAWQYQSWTGDLELD